MSWTRAAPWSKKALKSLIFPYRCEENPITVWRVCFLFPVGSDGGHGGRGDGVGDVLMAV